MANSRAFQLVMLDVTTPGREHEAVKSADLAALWEEGWHVVYCWILVREHGDPQKTEESHLCLVMAPPREGDDLVDRGAEREALAALVESATTEGPKVVGSLIDEVEATVGAMDRATQAITGSTDTAGRKLGLMVLGLMGLELIQIIIGLIP
jgi:hypothetical protein